jgi:hypothetical protein
MRSVRLALALLLLLPTLAFAQATVTGDPCAVMPKQSAAVAIDTATTTSIVAPATGAAIYLCGVTLTTGAATTFQLEYGTGSTCGTGTAVISGIVPTSLVSTPGNATQLVTPVSQRVCVLSVGTGGIHGWISYVKW